jgi:16S rRNA (cytidine1402-2'-O)-methyltransferase
LIKRSIEEGIDIVPIPGPTASIAALSISGLPTDAFIFEGFLPKKKGQNTKKIESLKDDRRTLILFESPHRIVKTLEELESILGDRRAAIVREVTKVYEEVIRGRLSEVKMRLENKKIRGEITLVIEGNRGG